MKKRIVAIMMAVMMTAVMAGCNATSETAGTAEIIESQTMDEGTETVPETTEEMVPETEQPIGEIEPAETQESVPETEKPVPESEESVPETEETNVESNDNTASKPETSPRPETDPKPETSPEPQTSSKSETGAYTYADLNKTMYAKSSVNVRNLPATSGTKLGSLKKNNEVTVTGQCNETGWYRIVYDDGEAFVSNKYLSDEKVAETNIAKNTNSSQTDFLTPDGYLNPNNPIVAAAYEKYGENIAICEDGTVLDAATWQVLGKIDGVPGSSNDETGSFDRAAAEDVWRYMNEERVSEGLNALEWDENIYNFACQRAQQIVTDFSHNGCGNYGENIEYMSAAIANGSTIHSAWYYSPGHHANYLNSAYGSGACAVYVYNGMIYAVENFALASGSNAQTTSPDSQPGSANGTGSETTNGESQQETEVVGEIDYGTTWTASNGVSVFIRSDGLVSVSSAGHTEEECKAALDEYYATH